MKQAGPDIAASYFYVFVFFFCYFAVNMYQAILIQTYNDLRRRRLLLSEAMARIHLREFKDTLIKVRNLVFCRSPKIYAEQTDG